MFNLVSSYLSPFLISLAYIHLGTILDLKQNQLSNGIVYVQFKSLLGELEDALVERPFQRGSEEGEGNRERKVVFCL